MKVGIGNDHAAVELKNEIKAYLEKKFADVLRRKSRTCSG